MKDAKIEANVEGIGLMSFRVIWFVIAGFVLGFTTSTLWEWLYYRQRRRRLLEQHQQTLLDAQRTSTPRPPRTVVNQSPQTDSASATADQQRTDPPTNKAVDPEWQLPAYRSSGIFLESEQKDPTQLPASGSDSSSASSGVATAPSQPASTETTPPTRRNDSAAPGSDQPSTKAESMAGSFADPSSQSAPITGSAASSAVAAGTNQTEGMQGTSKATKRALDHPDNLANIKGIGEAYKRRLYATGIYTWRQLAESDTETLRRITRAKPNADIQSWQIQARELAQTEGRWDANFNGPLDDFTRIEGIGAITADILYRFGICTYEQLAATNPDELARIVPAPTVGNENDFDGWIRDAAQLAQAKARNGGNLL